MVSNIDKISFDDDLLGSVKTIIKMIIATIPVNPAFGNNIPAAVRGDANPTNPIGGKDIMTIIRGNLQRDLFFENKIAQGIDKIRAGAIQQVNAATKLKLSVLGVKNTPDPLMSP
jgi:hypothetical protein